MFKTSVSRLLMGIQIVMLCGLLAAVVTLSISSLKQFNGARAIVADTLSNRALFDAVVKTRAQIARIQTAMVSQDDPGKTVEEARTTARTAYQEAVRLLANADIANKAAVQGKVEESQRRMEAEWSGVAGQIAQPRADRKVAATDGWRQAVLGAADALEGAAAATALNIRQLDARIGELMVTREAAWRLRDNMGAQCSLLRPFINESKPLTADIAQRWHNRNGAYSVDLAMLGEIARRPGASPALRDAVTLATGNVDKTQKAINELVSKLDGSGKPAMDAATYTATCNQPFDSILAIAYGALDLAVERAEQERSAALMLLVPSWMGLIGAIALSIFGILAIRRRVTGPTGLLREAIGHLSRQDYSVPVPPAAYPDELGSVASALESLRQSAGEAQRLQQEAVARQAAELERARLLRDYCQAFDQAAQQALGNIGSATSALDQTSGMMRQIASETSEQASMVSNAAEETSQSVQTVAAATEELSASISEISQRVTASADMAQVATEQAAATNHTVEALNDAAQRIGDVVGLISEIAAQTNLLALNATIEAARAGEAGKGFAVVASEVKSLATQTARATGDITVQVQNIQGTTAEAVRAIQAITNMIKRISEGTAAIAAAVEEQGAATREISSSVQQVAQGTAEVTTTIADLAQSSQQTGTAAGAVSEAVGEVVREQGSLRSAMEDFLTKVQRA
ncbi:methyl-accepting chemotaxis protein [Niveispirillum sp. BGYR6]|uniref:methyl-accepting chemotaxis protein n=1 Tax=Niveispirillum sp. BGYR6 TaxID=2971249 RepID=UPI0022B97B78|nr:methyl-accepting chemotaxis protein [Niveispirillum sp. BGYR6]MDG5497887.1 methyl-accepting chemotaxis protein [Niveispirillum sp. BGYR6]